MEKELLEKRLKELQQEYQKGMALLEDTKAKMLRLEGAMFQLQDLLKANGKKENP